MSIHKQMEDSSLTLEEIRELLELLRAVLPKIEYRAKQEKIQSTVNRNLDQALLKSNLDEGMIPPPPVIKPVIQTGHKLLKSANEKLNKFYESITL